MNTRLIKLLILVCCIGIFSCTKETKETIIIEGGSNTVSDIINGDGLPDEDLIEWDKLDAVNVDMNNVILPNGSTLSLFKNTLRKTDEGKQENSNRIISLFCESAGKIINYKTGLDVGTPLQTKLGYVFGDKLNSAIRNYKTKRQGLYCTELLNGLDCSGLIYNIFKESGFTRMPYMVAESQRKVPFLEKEFKKHNKLIQYKQVEINFDDIVIKDRGNLSGTSLATGDIIYWKKNDKAYHIGMILIEQMPTGKRIVIAASNGSSGLKTSNPFAIDQINCDSNYLKIKRGPNFYEIQPVGSPLNGFPNNYSIIRISEKVPCNAKTISGGFGVTPTLHSVGSKSGTILLNYEMYSIPDKLEVFYEGKLLFSTNGFVSGNKTESITYNYNKETEIEVIVTGNDAGTAWEYTVNCPE
jgi:hypothetical protein